MDFVVILPDDRKVDFSFSEYEIEPSGVLRVTTQYDEEETSRVYCFAPAAWLRVEQGPPLDAEKPRRGVGVIV